MFSALLVFFQDYKPNNILTGENVDEVKVCDLGCCSFGPDDRGLVTKGLGHNLYNVRYVFYRFFILGIITVNLAPFL